MPDFPTITIPTRSNASRIDKRNIVPSGVPSRHLKNIIFGSVGSIASTTMNNGDEIYVSYELDQKSGYELLGLNYTVVYIGSVDAANLLPGGSAIDESQWQLIGPFYSYFQWLQTGFAKHLEESVLYLRNISAGAQTVILQNKWRYISPREE